MKLARGLLAATFCWALTAGCDDPAPTPSDAPPEAAGPAVAAAPEAATLPDRPLLLGRPPHLSTVTRAEYEPLAAHLAEAIGHRIEVRVPGSYTEVVDLLVAGKLDMALLTPLTYVEAHRRVPNLRLLVSLLGEGSPKYRGYIVTKLGGKVHSVADLKGKRFAFVDRGSASGYLFPAAHLLDAGIDPEKDFAKVVFVGDHPTVVHDVVAGKVDGGAISSTTFNHLRSESLGSKLEIIAKTDWIPLDAFVAQGSLPESVATKLQAALIALNMRTPEGRAVLRGVTTTNGFVPGDDSLYDPVRRVAERVGKNPTR